jgi:HSP20 family protein
MAMSYQPYSLVNQLHNEINRVFGANDEAGAVAADWIPAVDIREDQGRYVLRADLPGIDPKDIEITMENGVLTIRGERTNEVEAQTHAYRRVERTTGRFFRRFTLPDSADAERISATGKHGVLEITIPKHERVQPRRIAVEH